MARIFFFYIVINFSFINFGFAFSDSTTLGFSRWADETLSDIHPYLGDIFYGDSLEIADEEVERMTYQEFCDVFMWRARAICKKAAKKGDRQYGLIRFCYEKTQSKGSLVKAICAQGIEKYGDWIKQEVVEACIDIEGVPRKVTECFDFVGKNPDTNAAFIRASDWPFHITGPRLK